MRKILQVPSDCLLSGRDRDLTGSCILSSGWGGVITLLNTCHGINATL